jgi:phosphatidylserine/phosphatidylglycerophosphate/cardiolipin synthase-like enzyme
MALDSLDALNQYKAEPFASGYPDDTRTFYAPVDKVHEALAALLDSATRSLVVAMYAYDDTQLNEIVRAKLASEGLYVQVSLDSSQASGKQEQAILAEWENNGVGNSIAVGDVLAIGKSEKGAIMHLKMVIIDGLDVLTGSTNWSGGGETKQDNQLTVIRNAVVAAEARSRIDIIHDSMLKQMAADTKQGKLS